MDSMRENRIRKEKLDVLDLIIDVLRTHEIVLDGLVERLECLCYKLEADSSDDDVRATMGIVKQLSGEPLKVMKDEAR